MENTSPKKKLGTLDIFIIVALIVCIVCFAVRYITMNKSDVAEKVELEEYTVSFKVLGIKDSTAQNYMEPGTRFFLDDTGAEFGSLMEGLTIKDAEHYYEMDDGSVVLAGTNAVGDLYRVDVEGKFSVKGKTDSNGSFLLNGNKYLGINKQFTLNSKYVTFNMTITDIQKSN